MLPRPEYWPKDTAWPLLSSKDKQIAVAYELETMPPTYVLEDGTKVRGTLKNRRRLYDTKTGAITIRKLKQSEN